MQSVDLGHRTGTSVFFHKIPPALTTQIYANSLRVLLEYDGDDFEDVFEQYFVVNLGPDEYELQPGGASRVVTRENRADFVKLYLDFFFVQSIAEHWKFFEKGFFAIVKSQAFFFLTPNELEGNDALILSSHYVDPINL